MNPHSAHLGLAENTKKKKAFVSFEKLLVLIQGLLFAFAGVGESARTLNVSFRRLSLRSAAETPPPHQHRNGNRIALYSEESARISSIRSLSSLSRGAWTNDDSGLTGSSHASTLDRLYAWEKKLYLEVKVCLLLPSLKF